MPKMGNDMPYTPASYTLQTGALWVESGRPLEEALDTHALLVRLRNQLYSPASPVVPGHWLWWRRYGFHAMVVWQ